MRTHADNAIRHKLTNNYAQAAHSHRLVAFFASAAGERAKAARHLQHAQYAQKLAAHHDTLRNKSYAEQAYAYGFDANEHGRNGHHAAAALDHARAADYHIIAGKMQEAQNNMHDADDHHKTALMHRAEAARHHRALAAEHRHVGNHDDADMHEEHANNHERAAYAQHEAHNARRFAGAISTKAEADAIHFASRAEPGAGVVQDMLHAENPDARYHHDEALQWKHSKNYQSSAVNSEEAARFYHAAGDKDKAIHFYAAAAGGYAGLTAWQTDSDAQRSLHGKAAEMNLRLAELHADNPKDKAYFEGQARSFNKKAGDRGISRARSLPQQVAALQQPSTVPEDDTRWGPVPANMPFAGPRLRADEIEHHSLIAAASAEQAQQAAALGDHAQAAEWNGLAAKSYQELRNGTMAGQHMEQQAIHHVEAAKTTKDHAEAAQHLGKAADIRRSFGQHEQAAQLNEQAGARHAKAGDTKRANQRFEEAGYNVANIANNYESKLELNNARGHMLRSADLFHRAQNQESARYYVQEAARVQSRVDKNVHKVLSEHEHLLRDPATAQAAAAFEGDGYYAKKPATANKRVWLAGPYVAQAPATQLSDQSGQPLPMYVYQPT